MTITSAALVGTVATQLIHLKDIGTLKVRDRLISFDVTEDVSSVSVEICLESARPSMTVRMTYNPYQRTDEVTLSWDHKDGHPARPAMLDPTIGDSMCADIIWGDSSSLPSISDEIAYALTAWANDTNPAHADSALKSGMDEYDRKAWGIQD